MQQYFYIFNCDICLNSFCAPHLQQLYACLPYTYQLGQEYNWIVWKTSTVDPDRLMAIMQTNSALILGRYKPGIDKPDPKTWKANFRCALNSLTDVKELQDKSIKKGHNAFRVYILLPHSKTIKRRKGICTCNLFGKLFNIYSFHKHIHCAPNYYVSDTSVGF